MADILTREGNYREAFPEDISGATRLNGNWSEDELDAFGTELPMVALDSLRFGIGHRGRGVTDTSFESGEIPARLLAATL